MGRSLSAHVDVLDERAHDHGGRIIRSSAWSHCRMRICRSTPVVDGSSPSSPQPGSPEADAIRKLASWIVSTDQDLDRAAGTRLTSDVGVAAAPARTWT